MFLKKLKKALTPSLSTMIGQQIKSHQRRGYSFREEIILIISEDYDGPYISATLKSTDPNASGFCASNQIWFYKCRVDTFAEAFNKLTSEVSVAKTNYPKLNFFRSLKIPEEYSADLITDWSQVDQALKVKMVKEGSKFQAKIINLYEIYSGGSWAISDCPSWPY